MNYQNYFTLQKDSSLSAVDIDIDDDVTSSLNTLLDTRPDSSNSVADQCNSMIERLASVHREEKSSESLDASNATVLHFSEGNKYISPPENHKNNNKNVELREKKEKRRSTCSEDDKHRHSGNYEHHHKDREHRRSGHFERTDRNHDPKNYDEKQGASECLKHSGELFLKFKLLIYQILTILIFYFYR